MREFKEGDLVVWDRSPGVLYKFSHYESSSLCCDNVFIMTDPCGSQLKIKESNIKKIAPDESLDIVGMYLGFGINKENKESEKIKKRHHAHYFKDVRNLKEVDVYRVITLFDVTNPCLAHAIKKLLVAGGRGGGKDIQNDVKEAIDSLTRFIEMQQEDLQSNNKQGVKNV